MDRDTYEAEKERLKRLRKVAGDWLDRVRHEPRPADHRHAYSYAVRSYTKTQDELRAHIHTYGRPSGIPSRAERRKAKLRRRGIKPVWD